MSTLRLSGTVNDSIVDGPGLRFAIFTQGCPHHCEGCHNPSTHDFSGGFEKDTSEILASIFENPLLDGVTFSGGEPMMQPAPLCEIAAACREKGLNVMIYTGFTWEELMERCDSDILSLLQNTDILVDGRFELSQRSLALVYKGSKNQRILNVAKSLAEKRPVEFCINEYGELV